MRAAEQYAARGAPWELFGEITAEDGHVERAASFVAQGRRDLHEHGEFAGVRAHETAVIGAQAGEGEGSREQQHGGEFFLVKARTELEDAGRIGGHGSGVAAEHDGIALPPHTRKGAADGFFDLFRGLGAEGHARVVGIVAEGAAGQPPHERGKGGETAYAAVVNADGRHIKELCAAAGG